MHTTHPIPAELAALIPAAWQTGQRTTDDGMCMYYTRTGGDKTPLLLVHGHMMSGLTWLRVAQALAADYDVIMPDLRGHGRSGDATTGYSMDLLAADLLALIHGLGLAKPLVIGHSNGAEAVLTLAASEPGLFARVVLEEPPFNPPPAPDAPGYSEWYQGWVTRMQAMQAEADFSTQMAQVRVMGGPWVAAWDDADFIPYADAQARFRLGVNDLLAGHRPRTADPDLLKSVTAPVLLMTGQPTGETDAIPGMIAALPDGTHQHFDGAGHMIHATQLAAFVAAVRAFFAT